MESWSVMDQLFYFISTYKSAVNMLQSKGSASEPTILTETLMYKIFCSSSAQVVGTLGYLSTLHTNNGSPKIMRRGNRKH
jgi:hypothetical protein